MVDRIVRDVEEQQERRRGWVRIFPTEDTWTNYGPLLDFSSSNNLVLHEHLYPQYIMRPLSKQRTRSSTRKTVSAKYSRTHRQDIEEGKLNCHITVMRTAALLCCRGGEREQARARHICSGESCSV